MAFEPDYTERVSSKRTEALFGALTILFFGLFLWRLRAGRSGALAIVFGAFFLVFLFYSVNYRTLLIRITTQSLLLKFGVFTWMVPLDNIESCCLDEIPPLMRYGGAGIHFMTIMNRYRASLNFLEYPRIAVSLKKKAGPVRDISFSTRQPEEVLKHLRQAISPK